MEAQSSLWLGGVAISVMFIIPIYQKKVFLSSKYLLLGRYA